MSWRTVVISNTAKLDYQMGFLVVRKADVVKIHLSEISMLIIETTSVSMTAALLSELTKKKIKVIFCDEKRNPSYEVKLDETYDSLVEKLENYIFVKNQLCGITCFITVNLKQFIPAEYLEEFYKSLFYKKINLVEIESYRGVYFPCEKEVVIDRDLCVIELN